ncbi:MAG: GTPase [Thermoguttaceae bacterium]
MADRPLDVIRLTPPGRGAIAALRIEGPGAVEMVAAHCLSLRGRPLRSPAQDRLVVGRFGGSRGEEVVLRRVSDEAVEIDCHGGPAAIARIEQVLVQSGCRPLGWQQWIARQESEPTAAAARIALAEARTTRTAAILLDQYRGALGRALAEVRAALARSQTATARQRLDSLRAAGSVGLHLVRPWQVVVAGPPNVGKSSLINALAGYPRAIVHRAPGTTRDAVTAETVLDGWPVELCDTAGLWDAADAVERAGIEVARRKMAQADLVLAVCDRSQPWSAADEAVRRAHPEACLVHNKSDLAPAAGPRPPGLDVSATKGEGIDALSKVIVARLVPNIPLPGGPVPFTQEQLDRIDDWLRELGPALEQHGASPRE